MTNQSRIQKLIQYGEGLNLEFKKCRDKLNQDVYQTICAFLNRYGRENPQMIEDDVFRIIVKVQEYGAVEKPAEQKEPEQAHQQGGPVRGPVAKYTSGPCPRVPFCCQFGRKTGTTQ